MELEQLVGELNTSAFSRRVHSCSECAPLSWMSSAVTAGIINNSRKVVHTPLTLQVSREIPSEGSTRTISAFNI